MAEPAAVTAVTAAQAGMKAIAAAMAVGFAAWGTSYAQAKIGSAGAGVLAEKPELLGNIIVLMALPELMVVFGFAISALILFTK